MRPRSPASRAAGCTSEELGRLLAARREQERIELAEAGIRREDQPALCVSCEIRDSAGGLAWCDLCHASRQLDGEVANRHYPGHLVGAIAGVLRALAVLLAALARR